MRERRGILIDRLIEAVFYIMIAVAMAFWGGVELWTRTFIHFSVLLITLLYLLRALITRRISFLPKSFYLIGGGFILSTLVSTIFSIDMNESIRSLALFLDAVIVFLVFASLQRGRKDIERFVYIVLVFAIANSLFAVYEPLLGSNPTGKRLFITGTFYNNNHFSSFLELLFFIPASLLYLKRDFSQIKRYFLFASLIASGLALAMSLSRGGIVSILLTMMTVLYISFKGNKRKVAVATLFF